MVPPTCGRRLFFPRYVLAVAVADGAAFRRLARKLSAFEAQFNSLIEGAGRYFAEFIVSGDAALLLVRANALGHARAFFTSDSTHADFHFASPVSICSFANRTPVLVLRQAALYPQGALGHVGADLRVCPRNARANT